MSRIDVVTAEKGKYKVLVNFIQHGVELSDPILANNAAISLKEIHYKQASLNLINATAMINTIKKEISKK